MPVSRDKRAVPEGLRRRTSEEARGFPRAAEEGILSIRDWGSRSPLPVSWAMGWVVGAYWSLTTDPISSLPSPVLQPLAP